MSLSWAAPSNHGGSALTDYVIQCKTSAAASWNTLSDGVSTGTSTTVTGLLKGTAYVFRVAAVNATGIGEWSIVVTAVPA